MKLTKKVLASSVAASVLSMSGIQAANAEIELGEGLSVTGFIDMSYTYTDVDLGDETEAFLVNAGVDVPTVSSRAFGVDQFEVDFLYTGSDGVSAQVDVEYGEGGEGDDTFVEQAFITKAFSDSFSVKAGRFLSYSGWETEEPTGLYQYSGTGYGGLFYGGYQQGVSAYYDGGSVAFMASAVNSAFDGDEGDASTVGTELGLALMPMEGFTAKLFYIMDEETTLTNFWTSYETGGFTFAFEYSMGEYDEGTSFEWLGLDVGGLIAEADGYLLMANYASGSFGITFRYHGYSIDAENDNLGEATGITLAPSFAVGDNLLFVAEYKMEEFDTNGLDSSDVNSFALEALYSF